MSLWKYKYFVDVVDTQSFTKAGKMNYVTQTAISQQISALEKSVGGKLLERGNGKLVVTELGKIVYKRSKEMLELNKVLTQEIEDYKEHYIVRVGIDSSINKKLWRCAQAIIDEHFDEDDFTFFKINYSIANTMLKDGALDIYIGYALDDENRKMDLEEHVLSTNPIGAYVGPYATLLELPEVSTKDLSNFKRYATSEILYSQTDLDGKLPKDGVGRCRIVGNSDTMKIKAEFNDGYALVDSYYFSNCDGEILPIVDSDEECTMKLFFRKDKNKERAEEWMKLLMEAVADRT